MLLIRNLNYVSQKKIILNNISAEFNEGEITGITGAAGCGKNLIINLLCNKEKNYEGDIFLNECLLKSADKKTLRTLISHYSSNSLAVNPESTVKNWILSGRLYHKKRLSPYSAEDNEIALKMINTFRLDQSAETRLKLLSETGRKMASLARAFSSQSEVMLLEKPDSGLNIDQRVTLTRALKKYTITGKKIVILTSSDINFLAASCDRILILSDGKIAESGTHGIVTAEVIKKYFNVESVVTRNIYSGLPEIQIIE
jgi:ABC-type cobalamin/Fe3+-siderophores transport system ATPase subunit